MTIAFGVCVFGEIGAEQGGNPAFTALHVDQSASAMQSGGNAEGKETRFGIAQSGIFTVATTAASCGAVANTHDSLTPIGGLYPLLLMQLGEVIFGGVGSGLYGMLVFALLAVFVAGLMIGRTPEYVGKKIEAYEMKMVSIVVLLTPLLVLVGTSIAVLSDAGKAGIANPGAHGFSEILYAFSSAANNNGSAFAGLTVGTPFYNWLTRHRDVVRPLRHHRPRARDCRLARRQEAHRRDRRHAADARAALRRAATRHGAAGRRAHVRAGARARPGASNI